jgi:hypothetical protein
MSVLKEEVQSMIQNLPDDCTIEDIQYHLYVIEKIQNGMNSVNDNKTIPQETAKQRMAKWL